MLVPVNSISEVQLDIIKEFLQKKIEPYLVVLFGSAAQDRLRPDSDVDLAFLSDLTLNDYDIFLCAGELSDKIGRDVDLINLATASTVFQTQVIGRGKTIYCSDELRRMSFTMDTLKEYSLLNEERQCIFNHFSERGFNYVK